MELSRPRRLGLRNYKKLVKETHITVDDLLYPLFVVEGSGIKMKYLPCCGFITCH